MTANKSLNSITAVKICGITDVQQALQIASLGADAIGVVGVKSSSRFLEEVKRRNLFHELNQNSPKIQRVWVVANIDDKELLNGISGEGIPSVVQLHGQESIKKCQELRESYPNIKWWKAISIRHPDDLMNANKYQGAVDAILIDTWDRQALGGTGKRIPIEWLLNKSFTIPWWLAGGVCSEWIESGLKRLKPYGIDASSRLEKSPGIKDINKVKSLLKIVKNK